jgi:hypothetical protein
VDISVTYIVIRTLESREFNCPGCGMQKWIYAWPSDIDQAMIDCEREHLLCSGDEVDIVTGEVVA